MICVLGLNLSVLTISGLTFNSMYILLDTCDLLMGKYFILYTLAQLILYQKKVTVVQSIS